MDEGPEDAAGAVAFWETKAKQTGEDAKRRCELDEALEAATKMAQDERQRNVDLDNEIQKLKKEVNDEVNKSVGKITATTEAFETLWLAQAEMNRMIADKDSEPLIGPLKCQAPPADVVRACTSVAPW